MVRNHFTTLAAHSELRIVTSKGVLALSPQAINITFQHVRAWLQQVIRVFTFVALPLSNTEQLEQVRRRALRHQAKLIRITSCKKSHHVGSESLVFNRKWTRWQESQDCVTWNESVFPVSAVRKTLSTRVRCVKHGLPVYVSKHQLCSCIHKRDMSN